eukprot:scaffold13478_cov132-Cylindrotheca_fusiformis.AAC.17
MESTSFESVDLESLSFGRASFRGLLSSFFLFLFRANVDEKFIVLIHPTRSVHTSYTVIAF